MEKDLVDYFIKSTDSKFEKVDERFDKVEAKLDDLSNFKWKLIGGASAISTLVTLIVKIFFEK